MAYLQKKVDTHGLSEEELSEAWDLTPIELRRNMLETVVTAEDIDELENVLDMELGYVSERCTFWTVQGLVDLLSQVLVEA